MNTEPLRSLDDNAVLQEALCRLYGVRPQWTTVRPAGEAVGLGPMTLLHAGPPFADPCQPSAPVLASAVLCCVYEGWARTQTQAEAMIADGRVRLLPAQDYRIVTPLAAVISPSTYLVEVVDAARSNSVPCWSLLSSGMGPQLRFGTRNPAILQRMAWRDTHLAQVLRGSLERTPIMLIPLAAAGLEGGDDLHSRTTVATAALLAELSPSLSDHEVRAMLETTPLFFLTLWMAACYLMLDATRSTDGQPAPKLLLALAGNGVDAGVRLADQPDAWITTAAHIPQGPRMVTSQAPVSPMLGDSGVIDAAGFGAQAWSHTKDVARDLCGWLPPPAHERPRWLVGTHPDFAMFNLGSAIDSQQVGTDEPAPRVAIAMLDATGKDGLLGRGVCLTDPTLYGFAKAAQPVINDPQSLYNLNQAFERYERALTGNDLAVLDELFWDSPHTIRYGPGEHLYGYSAIQAFRRARPGKGLERTVLERSVTSFGDTFAITHIVFSRPGEPRLGRQTQSWVRLAGDWRIVTAHVSWMEP